MESQVSTKNTEQIKPVSNLRALSFSLGSGVTNMAYSAAATVLLLYYTAVVGLDAWWFALAQTIYAVYNAVNDIIVGYISDRMRVKPNKFNRRFPLIAIGAIGMAGSVALIYAVPSFLFGNNLGAFFWMLISLCLFDTFYTLYSVNNMALFPVLFPEPKSRRRLGMFQAVVSTTFLLAGMAYPSLIVDRNNPDTFIKFVVLSGISVIVLFALQLPSLRMKQDNFDPPQKAAKGEFVQFFKDLWFAIKQKNFLALVIMFVLFQTFTGTAIASLAFYLEFIIGTGLDKMMTLIMIEFAFLYISLPFWNKIISKKGFSKTFFISMLLVAVASFALLFTQNIVQTMIVFGVFGIFIGGETALEAPIFADVMDELTVKFGERKHAMYAGLRVFFQRASLIFQSVIVAIVRSITKFDPSATTTVTDGMKFGIRMEMIGCAAILLVIGCFVFKKMYDLDENKMTAIRNEILERKL